MSNNKLSEQARRAKNAYQREWRRRNPDKVAASLRKHWERKGQELYGNAIETPTDSVTDAKRCRQCGQIFTPERSTALYCSVSCRVAHHRENNSRKTAEL